MFRLHIDLPLGENEELAAKAVSEIISKIPIQMILGDVPNKETAVFQYKMSRDEDTRVRNYLVKDAQGHVSTGKIKVFVK